MDKNGRIVQLFRSTLRVLDSPERPADLDLIVKYSMEWAGEIMTSHPDMEHDHAVTIATVLSAIEFRQYLFERDGKIGKLDIFSHIR